MIDKRELRIGNWVHHLPAGTNFQVLAIAPDEDDTVVEPIELTPDILVKAGFLFDTIDYNAYRLLSHLEEDGEDHWGDIEFHFFYRNGVIEQDVTIIQPRDGASDEFYPHAKIKYLHHLQNLYFCLTGQELTINLK